MREQDNYADSEGFFLMIISSIVIWKKDETSMKLVHKELNFPNQQKRLRKMHKTIPN